MAEDNVNFELSEDQQTQLDQAFETVRSILTPFQVVLSDALRKTTPRMADSTLAFVEKSIGFAFSHPQFKPGYVDADAMKRDLIGYNLSNRYLAQAAEISRMLEDIAILSGSEAYLASLSFYRNLKVQVRDNQPGAKVVFDELKARFDRQGKNAEPKK
jgi:hypothetical protein